MAFRLQCVAIINLRYYNISMVIMKLVTNALIFLALIGTYTSGMLFYLTHVPWVDLSVLEHYDPGKPSIILDDQGNEWGRFQIDRRVPVSLSDMPKHLIDAFLLAEDRHFFSHGGLSLQGIARSIMVNLARQGRVQGASTITQQLVRLLFFDQRKTFHRKIKEQLLSLAVERQFTKELILETYLNHLYFGCGIYGVQSASQRFWNKDVGTLTIDESATLAAIIASPARYCPLINPHKTQTRRNHILKLMRSSGLLADDDYQQLLQKQVTVKLHVDEQPLASHAREYIRSLVESMVGRKELYTGGLTIQTTLNISMQQAAEHTFKKHLRGLRTKLPADTDGALVTLAVKDGAIKALVGGYDFTVSQFNRAVQAQRQMGSVFKPLIYAIALQECGLDLDTIALDEPVTITDHHQVWNPHNFNKKFEGPMTLAHALATSKNTIAIKVLLHAGIDKIIDYAKKLNLAMAIEPYPSLALGCIDTTPLNTVAMYTMFAHKGIYHQPYLIEWVKDAWGKKIAKHKDVHKTILSEQTASKITQILSPSLDRFKQKHAQRWPDVPFFGKTGTTNQARTCWFAGSTPSFTTAVYIGCDNNQPLGKNVYSSNTAFPLWLDYNKIIGIFPQE